MGALGTGAVLHWWLEASGFLEESKKKKLTSEQEFI